MSADQPLTGDELATIKTRAEAPDCRVPSGERPMRCADFDVHPDAIFHCPECRGARTTLRLVAEIERLQAALDDEYAHRDEEYDARNERP